MRAWTLPCSTTRSTPWRISLSPTLTWRSSITRLAALISGRQLLSRLEVDGLGGQLGPVLGQVDEHVVARQADREGPHRRHRRGHVGVAGDQVEAAAVEGALDLAVLHPALGQRVLLVAAAVLDGVHRLVRADQGDRLVVGEL